MGNEYYYESELYREALSRETRLSVNVMKARIELLKMEHEIEAYRRSSGEDAAYKSAKDRFDCFKDALSLAAVIDDELYIQRLTNEQLVREKRSMEEKIKNLESTLLANNKAWEAL